MKVKSKKIFLIFALFMVLLCCFSAVSASEDVSDDIGAVSDDVAVDEVVSEVDSDDESIAALNDENLESVDDSGNGSLAVQDEQQVNDIEEVDSTLTAEDDNGQTLELTPADTIYVNISSTNPVTGRNARTTTGEDWSKAYGTDQGLHWALVYINNNGKVIVAEGNYTYIPDYSQTILDKYTRGFTIEGFSNNVVFSFEQTYNLDAGSAEHYSDISDGNYAVNSIITHKNIIFDCDIKLGSKNFNFIDCTFNKGVEITRDYQSEDICNITFENCIFANPKSDIVIADKNNVVYNECTFPVTTVDSQISITNETNVVIVTLTDNSSAPIAGATVKYTVNGGEEQTVTTGEDGKATITGLTGEVTIAVNYEGNESFKPISDSKFFNFTEEPVVPAKVATKITAPKVSAVYNVAKNLVITLTDKDGKALANKKVTVKVATISKTLTTNAKGQVSLNVATLVPKTYTATVKFAGDDSYIASSVSPKVVVSKAKPKITAKAKTFKVKVKTKKYTVTLKNNKGKVMKKVKLTLKVGKKTYKATTNSKGKATFKITKLTKKGKYTATVKFAGSKYYKALSKKVKITVKK